jgi:hypothetical protein
LKNQAALVAAFFMGAGMQPMPGSLRGRTPAVSDEMQFARLMLIKIHCLLHSSGA